MVKNTNHPLISVIVAIYQAEQYICRCLDSIKMQTFVDFEVILVDDGCLDNSGLICDRYVKEDKRFNIIHKQHEGVSIARQIGLNAAKGKYVIHADPDDWVEPDWLHTLYNIIEKEEADMAICGFEKIFFKKTVNHYEIPSSQNPNDIVNDLLCGNLHGSCCNKLIKKECFKRFDVAFHPQMTLCEDLFVICSLLTHNIKVVNLPVILYHYDAYHNGNSIARRLSNEDIRSYIFFINSFNPIFSSKFYDDGWYHVKSLTKERIFKSKRSEYDIISTFDEINTRYISEANHLRPWSLKGCVALSLKGYPKIAHILYCFVNKLHSLDISYLIKWKN